MQTLICVFDKRAAAQRAVERLLRSGFMEADIHLHSEAVQHGKCVLVVDAMGDHQAETAAVILHEQGAVEVEDHRAHEVPQALRPGVRAIPRPPEQSPLSDLVAREQR